MAAAPAASGLLPPANSARPVCGSTPRAHLCLQRDRQARLSDCHKSDAFPCQIVWKQIYQL